MQRPQLKQLLTGSRSEKIREIAKDFITIGGQELQPEEMLTALSVAMSGIIRAGYKDDAAAIIDKQAEDVRKLVGIASPTRVFSDRAEPGAVLAVRKAHYGEGKQPLDSMFEEGWADHFMAGSILRYLRRDKDIEHSIESAKRYWGALDNMCGWKGERPDGWLRARQVQARLMKILTAEELSKIV